MATRYPRTGKGTKWTARELAAVKKDWIGDRLSDSEGLTGVVRKSADSVSIDFRFAFKWEGKVTWLYCGSYPNTPIAEIRTVRDEAKKALAQGIDPRLQKEAELIQEQQKVKAVIEKQKQEELENKTFRDMFNAWLDGGVSRENNNARLIRTFNKDVLPAIGDKAVREITEHDLRGIYRKVLARGTELNPRERTVVSLSDDVRQLFKWADMRQPWRALLAEGNPALLVDIKRMISSDYTEERDRVLSPQEIRKLDGLFKQQILDYAAAENKRTAKRPLNPRAVCAVWLCLATICRIGELLMSRWEHIDFDTRIWFIPAANTKSTRGKKQDHYVYLSDFALKQFKALRSLTETEWCFPSRDGSNHVCVKSVSKLIGDRQAQFKDRPNGLKGRRNDNTLVIGAEEWTPHDMRRTGATMMQSLGVSLDVIDRCQNHIIQGARTRRHYMKYDYAEEKREAWESLGAHIEEILKSDKLMNLNVA